MSFARIETTEKQTRCWEEVIRILPGNSFAIKQIESLKTHGMQTDSLFQGPSPYDPPPFTPPQFDAEKAIQEQTNQIEAQFHEVADEFHHIEENITRLSTVIKDLEEYERVEDKRARRRQISILPAILFLGTLMGSLLGATADLGETLNSIEQFRSMTYPKLYIVGSNTILGEGLGMVQEWGTTFEDFYDVRVNIRDIGSTAGVRAAANGDCANILAMSEPITEPQQNTLANAGVEITCAAEIGYDMVTFVTHNKNQVESLNIDHIRSIIRGELSNWAEISGEKLSISIFARKGNGTTEFILLTLAGYRPTTQQPFPPDALNYISCATNNECLDRTLSRPGSLYWVGIGWLRTQPEQYLQVVPISGDDERKSINPLDEEIEVTNYPEELLRPLYLYVLGTNNTTDRQTELAIEFLSFARGVQGQQTLEQFGYFNHFLDPLDGRIPLPEGFAIKEGQTRQLCK